MPVRVEIGRHYGCEATLIQGDVKEMDKCPDSCQFFY